MNDQTNEDIFILDCDQTNHSDERQSTPPPNHLLLNQPRAAMDERQSIPPPNHLLLNQPRAAITYEIVNTQDQHVVLVREQSPIDTTNVENERGIKRRFSQDNPVIPDDIFLSPISSYSSAEDTVSDWDTHSTCRSYDSMRDDLPTLLETPIRSISHFILPDETAQGSRGLSQTQLSCEHCNELSAVYEEGKWE